MTTGFDLLGAVLPPEGRFCVLGIESYIHQKFFDSRAEFDAEAAQLVHRGFDVYFGCAKYGPEPNRKKRNALYFRSLWMDLDCGPTKGAPDENGVIKGYPTQSDAIMALSKFCIALNLPRPIIVDSGYGVHVYWPLTETVDRSRWEALAGALRAAAQTHGLIVDPAVFEAARVLRVPGTLNLKDPQNPITVAVISEITTPLSYAEWKELLKAPEPVEEPSYLPRRLSPLMEALSGDRSKSFRKIMMRAANGDGCAQLLYAYENQATVEYPLWRAALSIPAFCEDKDFGIHIMSKHHPGYDPAETARKADDIGGPYTCATFEKINPSGCANCPLKGKIKSPITLGADIVSMKAEPEPPGDTPESAIAEGAQAAEPEESAQEASFLAGAHGRIPVPSPYIIAQSGAIYEAYPGQEKEPTLIYEYPLHVIKRMLDPNAGEVALVYVALPRDGEREFVMPLSVLSAKEKARDELAKHGVVVMERALLPMQRYLITCVKNLQLVKKAEIMHSQFGWAKDQGEDIFIVGERAYSANNVYHSPASSTTNIVAPFMNPTGTIEGWREVFDLYAQPGMEPQAFAALTAFGSPLLRYTGLNGGIINLIHPSSGSGKSTALYMCNSVWGHPESMGLIWKDTMNAKMHRLGVLNNLPVTVDEITNMSAQDFSNFAYSISQGRGANRMKASANEERRNTTFWQLIGLCSSNASFADKLGAIKASPDGELMRTLEYHVPPTKLIDPTLAKEKFDVQLKQNYGHAGPIYIRYVMNCEAEVVALLRQVQAAIDARLNIAAKERFWSAIVACNITGGLIAGKGCNLHNFNMQAILDWVCGIIDINRNAAGENITDGISVLGEFTSENLGNTLVINAAGPSNASHLQPAAEASPRFSINVRYEPDAHRLYVRASALKEFCAARQISLRDMLLQLEKDTVYEGAKPFRLARGMAGAAAPVHCYVFNTQAGHPMSLDGTIANATQAAQQAV